MKYKINLDNLRQHIDDKFNNGDLQFVIDPTGLSIYTLSNEYVTFVEFGDLLWCLEQHQEFKNSNLIGTAIANYLINHAHNFVDKYTP